MRRLLRHKLLLPAAVLVTVAVGSLLSFGAGAGASSHANSSDTGTGTGGIAVGGGVNAGNFNSGIKLPAGVGSPNYLGGPKNSGNANSSLRVYRTVHGHRELVAYGNRAIIYKQPPAALIPVGEALFAQNCSTCHGSDAQGSAIAPNLVGVGPATVNFWVSSGRMPAVNTDQVEAERKPARLSPEQALAVAAWVNSLDPAVPFVPYPNLKGASLSEGASLFALNCAACHTIDRARATPLAYGTNAPTLNNKNITPQQVAEAIRTGPANMPRFTGNLSDAQVRDLVAYVTAKIQHPQDPGGWGLGGVGPVTEGFVALLVGVGALVLVCFWIGERS